MTRTLSIAIKESTYQTLKQKIGYGKISSFVNQALERELKSLVQANKKAQEQLRQQLIQGYQIRAKDKKLQRMLRVYGEMSLEDLNAKLEK